jgi:Ras-related protein Rab-7A
MKSIYKIIIIGDSSVGKTSLLKRYITDNFSERYKSTIGVDFLNKILKINNRLIEVQIWDTAGTDRFYSMSNAFYRGTDACIVVFDLTNIKSFLNLESWIDEFLINANPIEPESYPFAIVGNKADLHDEIKIFPNMINKFCQTKNINYFETSSKLNINIDAVFEYLIDRIISQDKNIDISYDSNLELNNTIKLNDDKNINDENKYYNCSYNVNCQI